MIKKPKLREPEQEQEQENTTTTNNTDNNKLLWNLPQEVFLEILSRLPLKPLMLCKCVSKTWKTLLEDPNFTKLHLTRSSQQNPDVILATHSFTDHEKTELYYMQQMGDRNHLVNLTPPFHINSLSLVDSCNGLLCLFQIFCNNPIIVVCNPLTLEYVKLPQSEMGAKPEINFQVVGFGFHPKTNQYKVLRLLITWKNPIDLTFRTEAEVYTLGGGSDSGSWRRIGDAPFAPYLNHNVLLNGALHWMKWGNGSKVAEIYSFDIGDEEFRLVPFPSEFVPNGESQFVRLDVLDERLALVDHSEQGRIEIWVMKCYGVKDSWAKRYVIPVNGFHIPKCVRLVCVLKNGEILIQRDGNKLMRYDHAKGCVRGFNIHKPQRPFATFAIFAHVASLISPRRITGDDQLTSM